MKTLVFIVLLLLALKLPVSAQNYYTINVEGKISCNNRLLKTGDKLTNESIIKFSDKSDKLYLLSPGKGYFLLSPESKADKTKSWVISLKEAVIPANKYYSTATRGIQEVNSFEDIYDLMGFFRDKVMIIDKGKFILNKEKLPLDKNNYFEFKATSGNNVDYHPGDGYFILTGKEGKSKIEMEYIQSGKKTKIGTFDLVIKSRESFIRELSVFFQDQDGTNPSAIYFGQVLPFISEAYGNTLIQDIQSVIREDLKIPISNQ